MAYLFIVFVLLLKPSLVQVHAQLLLGIQTHRGNSKVVSELN